MIGACTAGGSIGYAEAMTAKALKEALQRVETWPEEVQEELAEIALEIDAGLKGGPYRATPEELEGIDRGLKAAQEGRFATDEEVEAILAKHRGK
jgi:predicted transcriptional regulator